MGQKYYHYYYQDRYNTLQGKILIDTYSLLSVILYELVSSTEKKKPIEANSKWIRENILEKRHQIRLFCQFSGQFCKNSRSPYPECTVFANV
jgi:hypothetical protein